MLAVVPATPQGVLAAIHGACTTPPAATATPAARLAALTSDPNPASVVAAFRQTDVAFRRALRAYFAAAVDLPRVAGWSLMRGNANIQPSWKATRGGGGARKAVALTPREQALLKALPMFEVRDTAVVVAPAEASSSSSSSPGSGGRDESKTAAAGPSASARSVAARARALFTRGDRAVDSPLPAGAAQAQAQAHAVKEKGALRTRFVALSEQQRWLPPEGVWEGLLTDSFLVVAGAGGTGGGTDTATAAPGVVATVACVRQLLHVLGVTDMPAAMFYLNHALPQVPHLTTPGRLACMGHILDNFEDLTTAHPALRLAVATTPFMQADAPALLKGGGGGGGDGGGGSHATLCCPRQLHDPTIPAVAGLVDGVGGRLPCAADAVALCTPARLAVLHSLGLRKALLPSAVLACARHVAAMCSSRRAGGGGAGSGTAAGARRATSTDAVAAAGAGAGAGAAAMRSWLACGHTRRTCHGPQQCVCGRVHEARRQGRAPKGQQAAVVHLACTPGHRRCRRTSPLHSCIQGLQHGGGRTTPHALTRARTRSCTHTLQVPHERRRTPRTCRGVHGRRL